MTGQASLSTAASGLGRSGTSAIALGDLDGDGDLDAFIGNGGFWSNSNADEVWFNDGLGQ